MFLRLILVSLVTSMGLELPSDRDVSCFTESVSAWANANICHLAGPEVATVTQTPVTADAEIVKVCESAPADVTFESVQAEIAAEFAAESLAVVAETPTTFNSCGEPEVVTLTETTTIGLPDGEELATIVTVVSDEHAAVVIVEEAPIEAISIASNDLDTTSDFDWDADALEVEADAPAPADQVTAAVRLTREAARAWAGLFQKAADEATCGR